MKTSRLNPRIKRALSSEIGKIKPHSHETSRFYHMPNITAHHEPVCYVEERGQREQVEIPKELTACDPTKPVFIEGLLNGRHAKRRVKQGYKFVLNEDDQEHTYYLPEKQFREAIDIYESTRHAVASRALNDFLQKDDPTNEELFWVAEDIGHRIMDHHRLVNRHIGTEVVKKVPFIDKRGRESLGKALGDSDFAAYGKDSEGKRKAVIFEIQPKFELKKIWYGLTDRLHLDEKEVELMHSIILSHRMEPNIAKFLGLAEDKQRKRGFERYYRTAGHVDMAPLFRSQELMDERTLNKVEDILERRHPGETRGHSRIELPRVMIEHFAESLSRTAIVLADQDKNIKQVICFAKDKHARLAPIVIDYPDMNEPDKAKLEKDIREVYKRLHEAKLMNDGIDWAEGD